MVEEVAEGVARVATSGGLTMLCKCRPTGTLSTGASVSIFVRPEFISAARATAGSTGASDPATNALTGRVDSVLFNGANSRILVRGPSHELIEADVTVTGTDRDLRPGDNVLLRWSPEQSMCYGV